MRVSLNFFVFIGLLFLPWWVTLIGVLILLARYNAYEVIVWAFLFDALYAGVGSAPWQFEFYATTVVTSLYLILRILKQHLFVYSKTI